MYKLSLSLFERKKKLLLKNMSPPKLQFNDPLLTPLSIRLSNSSLMRRSCRPYFFAAHSTGGADLERPRNGAPSVGVPTSSSTLAWNSSSRDTAQAWDSELSRIRPGIAKWGDKKGQRTGGGTDDASKNAICDSLGSLCGNWYLFGSEPALGKELTVKKPW